MTLILVLEKNSGKKQKLNTFIHAYKMDTTGLESIVSSFLLVLSVIICVLGQQTLGIDLTRYGKICNVSEYGAVGDNKTDNTMTIQAAIDDCDQSMKIHSSSVLNLVLLSTQSKYSQKNIETIYISGSLFLVSNLVFFIDHNVRLLGTSNKSNDSYPQVCILFHVIPTHW